MFWEFGLRAARFSNRFFYNPCSLELRITYKGYSLLLSYVLFLFYTIVLLI